MKIATWSGPRNISTALMRSWSSREDTTVVDEPFYASYLFNTQLKHPAYKEIISQYAIDYEEVVENICGDIPKNKKIWYQKHMAHHINNFDSLSWVLNLKNCILIRNPGYVINSYIKKNKLNNIEELGYIQQFKIMNYLIKNNTPFIVVEADSLLNNPKKILKLWCEYLDIPFTQKMLKWDKGYHPNDGIWSTHWYNNVIKSSSFTRSSKRNEDVKKEYLEIYDECMFYYKKIKKFQL